ncbi:MAG: hypothetical protein HQL94_07555 [Magnetococcales bacterium]|nr:hypothetical protein [Magnetococcales bacterium]
MPVIDPTSLDDCIDFINKNRNDIQEGTYDVKIRAEWLATLPLDKVRFLLEYCVSTKKVVARVIKGTGQGTAILERLGLDDNQEVRLCVASNPHTPTATLIKLAEDYFEEVRLAVASNPMVPDELLNQMSLDKSTHIRNAVVRNPKTPLKIINRLATDRSKVVADAVIQLARTTKSSTQLNLLAKCAQPEVRATVCENRELSLDVIDVLCRDENLQVRESARKRLLILADSPTTPPALLRQFAALDGLDIPMALSRNPATPLEILEKFLTHPDEQIRLALAANPTIPESLLLALAGDASLNVRLALAKRSALSWPVLERLTTMETSHSSPVMEALANNPSERERRKLHHLCVECGKKLTGMGMTFTVQCFSCMGKKIIHH